MAIVVGRTLARMLRATMLVAAWHPLSVGCRDAVTDAPSAPPQAPVPPVDPNDPAFTRSVHVVDPAGSARNTGDSVAPWDLATALAGASGRVTPGDTIWVRPGTYRGAFASTVRGAPGAPVLVRALPGRVTLSHAGAANTTLEVRGEWVTFWGLEVTNESPTRSTLSLGNEQRANGVVNGASHTRFVNLVIHDAGVGFYTYAHASDVELVGSILYNNGWQAPDRGHGHAAYLKSETGPLVVRQNVMFNQFGWGIHAYSNAGSGALNGIVLERNVVFNSGLLARDAEADNILLGGDAPSTGSIVADNIAWFPGGVRTSNVRIGFGDRANGTVAVAGNRFLGGDPVLRVGTWAEAHVSRNTLAGDATMVELTDPTLTGYAWSGTVHRRDPLSASWSFAGLRVPFLLWVAQTGLGLDDLASVAALAAPEVIVLPDANDPGRAFVVVLNAGSQPEVAADLESVLGTGVEYDVWNVQSLFDPPVASGVVMGPVSLPTAGVPPPIPIGLSSTPVARTGPALDVFLVVRR